MAGSFSASEEGNLSICGNTEGPEMMLREMSQAKKDHFTYT